MAEKVVISLNHPAVFLDLNLLEGRAVDHKRNELKLRPPTFKDLPMLKERNYQDKVNYCALEMASLSHDDIDELSVADGKQVLQCVLNAILEFNEAFKDYWQEEHAHLSKKL
jgi:hypothetical protein